VNRKTIPSSREMTPQGFVIINLGFHRQPHKFVPGRLELEATANTAAAEATSDPAACATHLLAAPPRHGPLRQSAAHSFYVIKIIPLNSCSKDIFYNVI
jgi:hypothetical protein